MKKSFLILCTALFSFGAFASGTGEEIYEKLKAKHTESFSMSLSKNMIDFFDMDLDFNGKEKWITGDFHQGRILILEDVQSTKQVTSLFEQGKYHLVEKEDASIEMDETEAYLYVSRKGRNVDEAHFVINNDEGKVTILSVFGNIQVKNK